MERLPANRSYQKEKKEIKIMKYAIQSLVPYQPILGLLARSD
jgi:hypothetical protein